MDGAVPFSCCSLTKKQHVAKLSVISLWDLRLSRSTTLGRLSLVRVNEKRTPLNSLRCSLSSCSRIVGLGSVSIRCCNAAQPRSDSSLCLFHGCTIRARLGCLFL